MERKYHYTFRLSDFDDSSDLIMTHAEHLTDEQLYDFFTTACANICLDNFNHKWTQKWIANNIHIFQDGDFPDNITPDTGDYCKDLLAAELQKLGFEKLPEDNFVHIFVGHSPDSELNDKMQVIKEKFLKLKENLPK